MLRLRQAFRAAREERGFTLIEVLVAMLTGIVVTGALFAILEFSTRQTARLSEVSQSSQIGRTAMTHIVDELHSACLSQGFAPVQAGSTPSKLVFVNGYFPERVANEAKEPEYSFVRKDEISWSSAGKGTLKDQKYTASEPAKEGEYKGWTTGGNVLIAENIAPFESEKANQVFKYYKYAAKSTTGTAEEADTLEQIPLSTETSSLTTEQANTVAAVAISFRTSPYKDEARLSTASEKGTPLDQTTLTTFAFSAPNSETTITAGPCE
ncbi:MAG: PilW family protein [Solirubrobacteraceae bacterium]